MTEPYLHTDLEIYPGPPDSPPQGSPSWVAHQAEAWAAVMNSFVTLKEAVEVGAHHMAATLGLMVEDCQKMLMAYFKAQENEMRKIITVTNKKKAPKNGPRNGPQFDHRGRRRW